jgi:hypothetical protein
VSDKLEFTGERFLPGTSGEIQWERGNALDGVVAEWQAHSRE